MFVLLSPSQRRPLALLVRVRRAVLGTLAAGLLATAGCAGPPAAAAEHGGGPIARTTDGLLRGKHAEGVEQFLGVPYAAPPAGALRWQAPQPATPWNGVRDATAYGNRCPQLASQDGPRQDAEDCLFLNVFTPAGGSAGDHRDRVPAGGCRCCSGSTAASWCTARATCTTGR